MQLGDYLAHAAAQPWNPGTDDCCTFTADWCVARGYPDPMAFIRGTYSTEVEIARLMLKPGLLRLAQRGYSSIGLARVKDYHEGDVAVIRRLGETGPIPVCAIRVGDRWASRMDRGLFVGGGDEVLRAWRVAK